MAPPPAPPSAPKPAPPSAPGRVPASALADTVLSRLTAAYPPAGDPVRAERAAAYLKGVCPFLGIPATERRTLDRTLLKDTAKPDETDCTAIALRCWELREREYHYFAVDYLRRHVKRCSSGLLPVARQLITTTSWWDTVDALAAHVVGGLVSADQRLTADMDRWIEDDDRWVVRSALLHQLRFQECTDSDRLFAYCLRQAGQQDFFIRKAIGWALRTYAKTAPEAVRGFVEAHREQLSPLSVREAMKHL